MNLSQSGLRWVGEDLSEWPEQVTIELEPGYEIPITGRVVWSAFRDGVSILGFEFDQPLPTVYGWFKMMEAA